MKGNILLLILTLSTTTYCIHKIGWTIPTYHTGLPETFETGYLAINFPDFTPQFTKIDKNFGVLRNTLSSGLTFKTSNAERTYPLPEIAARILTELTLIELEITYIKSYTENTVRTGEHTYDATASLTYTVQDLLPDLLLTEITTYINHLTKNKDVLPEPGREAEWRSGVVYTKLVTFETALNTQLRFMRQELSSYCKMMRIFAIDKHLLPTTALFITPYLSKDLAIHVTPLSLIYFESDKTKVRVIIDIGKSSGSINYILHENLQYFGYRMKNKMISKTGGDTYYEQICNQNFPNTCYHTETNCSKSLKIAEKGDEFTGILKFCNFETDTNEFDIYSTQGVVVNRKPYTSGLTELIDRQSFELPTYPVLLRFKDCLELEGGARKYCFEFAKAELPSTIVDSGVNHYLNPLWYNILQKNLTDPVTILTFFILLIISLVLYFVLKIIFKLIKIVVKYLIYALRSCWTQMTRTRTRRTRRSRSTSRTKPILKEPTSIKTTSA